MLLDLYAAFDTLDHGILLQLLEESIGISGIALAWFKSYLTGRSQSVFIDGIMSAMIFLLFGVPQGSVLGPLLFCIYILTLGKIIRKHGLQLHIYADDTQIYGSFNIKSQDHATSVLASIEACINDVRCWMSSSKLKLNDDKTEFLLITSPYYKNAFKNLTLSIGQVEIIPTDKAKNLGVFFDQLMDMKCNI